jgi:adenylyl-sulfate kinase
MTGVTNPHNIVWSHGLVQRSDRVRILKHRGLTVWMTGLPASGKSTVGVLVERRLIERGMLAYRVDGDNLRHGLNRGLGFAAEERAENVRRAGEACLLLADANVIAVACLVSPYVRDRAAVRARHEELGVPFLEVFIDVPVSVAESRDPKGHYKKARSGAMTGFTGVDDPYEPPPAPEVVLRTHERSADECADELAAAIVRVAIAETNARLS